MSRSIVFGVLTGPPKQQEAIWATDCYNNFRDKQNLFLQICLRWKNMLTQSNMKILFWGSQRLVPPRWTGDPVPRGRRWGRARLHAEGTAGRVFSGEFQRFSEGKQMKNWLKDHNLLGYTDTVVSWLENSGVCNLALIHTLFFKQAIFLACFGENCDNTWICMDLF